MEVEESKIKIFQITFKQSYCSSGAGQDFVVPLVIPDDLLGCVVIFPGGYTGRVKTILNNAFIIDPPFDITLAVGVDQSIAILPGTQKPKPWYAT